MWNLAILQLEIHVSNLNMDVMERELPRYILCKSFLGRWTKKKDADDPAESSGPPPSSIDVKFVMAKTVGGVLEEVIR